MITLIITQVEAIAAAAESTTSGRFSLIIFLAVLAILAAIFIYFLRKTDKLVDFEIAANNPLPTAKTEKSKDLHGEEAAAIALAIHLYKSDLHDQESFTITLQKVSRIYSPWSSKIYTLRQNPR